MSSLKTAEDGHPGLYVLGWPLPGDTTVPRVAYRRASCCASFVSRGWLPSCCPVGFSPQRCVGGWSQPGGGWCGWPFDDSRGARCGGGRSWRRSGNGDHDHGPFERISLEK